MTDRVVLFGDGDEPDEPTPSVPDVDPDFGDLSVLDGAPLHPVVSLGHGADDPVWAPPAPGTERDDEVIDGFDDEFDVDDFIIEGPDDSFGGDADPDESSADPWPVDPWAPDAWSPEPPPTAAPSPPADDAAPPPVRPAAAPPRKHLVISDFDDEPELEAIARSTPSPVVPARTPPAATPIADSVGGKVVIDATDEPPDAVVLGAAPRDGGGTLTFGDDDDVEIVLPGEKPKMDERVRKRRISVKRSAGRRRLRLLLFIAIPLVVIAGGLAALSSSLFAVDDIVVTGNVYTTDADLEPILATVRGEPTLTIDTQKLEGQLAALPWVRRASADARFPHRLVITIVERDPAATYAGTDGQWRVIDVDGGVIAVIEGGGQPADLLPILGAGPDLAAGQNSGPAYQTLAQLATTLDGLPSLRPAVASLAASGPDIAINLTTGAVVNLGSSNDLRAKLAVVLTLLSDPERKLEDITSINVSDPTKPAIQ